MSSHPNAWRNVERSAAFVGSWALLPNPDPVLKAMGADIDVYRRLVADPDVAGMRTRRIAAVAALQSRFADRSVAATPPRVIAACANLLRDLDIRLLVHTFIDGAFYGYRVAEIVWEHREGLHCPAIHAKPFEWFGFGQQGELRFIRGDNRQGIAVPAEKFVVVGSMRSWENPYGEPDLAACFWPVVFKSAGIRYWMTFAEKFGMPWAIGRLPRDASPEEADALAEKLSQMVRDAVMVLPDDGSVTLLRPNGEANGRNFEAFARYCRSEIAIALLGTNRGIEVNEGALLSMKVEASLALADAQMIAAGINQVLRAFVAVNFPGEKAPALEFYDRASRQAARVRRDEMLRRAGCKLSQQYFRRTYGFLDGDLEEAGRGVEQ